MAPPITIYVHTDIPSSVTAGEKAEKPGYNNSTFDLIVLPLREEAPPNV